MREKSCKMNDYCMFCLKSAQGDLFQRVSVISGDQFKLVLPELDLNLTESPLICSDCTKSLQDAYNFKTVCLKSQEQIKSFIENKKDLNVDNSNWSESSNGANNVSVKSENEDEDVNDSLVGKGIKCEVCGKEYAHKRSLTRHMKRHDVKNETKEVNNFTDLDAMKNENRLDDCKNDKGGLFKCNVCKKSFSKKFAFELHRTIHEEKQVACELCEKRFANLRYLNDHISRIHNNCNGQYTCEICGKIFALQNYLQRHIYRVHTYKNKGKYCCDVCKRRFPKSTLLRKHKLAHVDELKYPCSSCDERFSTKFHLQKHINDKHYDKPEFMKYFCPVCDEQFQTYGEVLQHRRESHMTQKNPHTCEICGIACYTGVNLQTHMRTHTGERPFACDVCGKAFSQKGSLNVHKKAKHSSLKPFVCNQCERSFVLKSSLMKHFKSTHFSDQVEKKFKCTQCPKAYAIQSQLTYHMRWHTGERLYICSTCGKRFVSKTSLQRHHLIHSDEKSNVCEVCGKGFRQKGNLKIHMKVHNK